MKSILQSERECFLCHSERELQVHHCIHGMGRRRLADEDGLTVYLCQRCHSNLHDKGANDLMLQEMAEEAWIERRGYAKEEGIEKFRERYGRSYI